jgi:biotin synthase
MSEKSWTIEKITSLFELPFTELLFQAQTIHRQHFKNTEIELCTLLSIKTGACPEDCGYCSQSGHHDTGLQREKLLSLEIVKAEAKRAKQNGSTRFCIGGAWRTPPEKDLPKVIDMIKAIKSEGLEACATLGMLDEEQAKQLAEAGLDFYNHNLDTSPEHYGNIVSTRTYQDRLDTLEKVRTAGINVCCGGILGMGETREDRISFLYQLTSLPEPPKSVPINRLIPFKGTPMEACEPIDNLEFVRTIAAARILMPISMIRLSAGRETMSNEMQALCYMAGANSIWLGDKLLTAPNPNVNDDKSLLQQLGMTPMTAKQACC